VRLVAATSLPESEDTIAADAVADAFGVGSDAGTVTPLAEAELGLSGLGPRLFSLSGGGRIGPQPAERESPTSVLDLTPA
jgi:hypothetical protein